MKYTILSIESFADGTQHSGGLRTEISTECRNGEIFGFDIEPTTKNHGILISGPYNTHIDYSHKITCKNYSQYIHFEEDGSGSIYYDNHGNMMPLSQVHVTHDIDF